MVVDADEGVVGVVDEEHAWLLIPGCQGPLRTRQWASTIW